MAQKAELGAPPSPKTELTELSGVLGSLIADVPVTAGNARKIIAYETAIARHVREMTAILDPYAKILLGVNALLALQKRTQQDPATPREEILKQIKRGIKEPEILNAMDLVRDFGSQIHGASTGIDGAYQLLVDIGEVPTRDEAPATPRRTMSPSSRSRKSDSVDALNEGRTKGLEKETVAVRLRALDDRRIRELILAGEAAEQIAEELEMPLSRIEKVWEEM